MSAVEARERLSTPKSNSVLKDYKELDVLIQPDLDRYEPELSLNDTITIVQSSDRILPPIEPQKAEYKLLELSADLRVMPGLKEAGYNVLMEMGRLFRNINSGIAVEAAVNELEVNLRTYDLEIIKSRPVLPHLNRFGIKDGVLRMVGNNGEPVINAVSAKERNGAVLEASQKIEDFLLTAENNSFAVLMNPAGWNGFTDEFGREAEPHLNAEVMVFWKNRQGELKGLTLVVDLKEEEARKTMISLGVSGQLLEGKNEHKRLVNLVKNPALLSLPEAYTNPFICVLEKMLDQRGKADFRLRMRDGSVETRSLEEVKRDIARFEELLLSGQEEEKLIFGLKRFILETADRLGEKSLQQEIVYRIEKAILLLTREYRQNSGIYFKAGWPVSPGIVLNNQQEDFSAELAFLKTRAGCPASMAASVLGGSSLGSAVGGGSGGFVESDQYGSLEFECPHVDCKKKNRRQRGRLIPNCQHCGKSVRC